MLCFSAVAFAQSINVNKGTVSNSESPIFEIQAAAIPADRKHLVVIDSNNYHKARNISDETFQPAREISIVGQAVKYDTGLIQSKKKEIQGQEDHQLPDQNRKKADVSAPATKR